MVRQAIESLYSGVCSIFEYVGVIDETTKKTNHIETAMLIDQPCRLSFKNNKSTNQTESGAELMQSVKLFIAPEIHIKPGSKIVVLQNGFMAAYKNSGASAVYQNHQEVPLELFEKWC